MAYFGLKFPFLVIPLSVYIWSSILLHFSIKANKLNTTADAFFPQTYKSYN